MLMEEEDIFGFHIIYKFDFREKLNCYQQKCDFNTLSWPNNICVKHLYWLHPHTFWIIKRSCFTNFSEKVELKLQTQKWWGKYVETRILGCYAPCFYNLHMALGGLCPSSRGSVPYAPINIKATILVQDVIVEKI